MLRQGGSIDEFMESFDMMASQITGITDEKYLGLSIGGLKEEIRMELQVLEPTTQYKAISMARNVKRKLIQAGTLKGPIMNKKSNFQNTYPRERDFTTVVERARATQCLRSLPTKIWMGRMKK